MTNQDALTQGILNYLKMDSSGAFLLTGTWGCGKTYYIKNELFPAIEKMKENACSFIPIMVSLYGIENLADLPKRIVTEYLDCTAKKEVNDGSPMRVYDCALCPECGETLYEKAIVGAFETEIK